MMLITIFVQFLIAALVSKYAPSMKDSSWSIGLLVGIPLYCVGFPVFLKMIKNLPNGPKGEVKKMSLKNIVVAFFISMAGTYIFNIVGNVINILIGLIKGSTITNPVNSVVEMSSIIPTIIFMVTLSPIIEEVIFRGVILDKLRGYGDRNAIFFTALTFALFHGNLSQFFYAFALGLIFGYIAIKTNTILYTVILHIGINLFGSVIMPGLVLSGNETLIMLTGLSVIVFMVVGIILFNSNFKNIELEPKENKINRKIKNKIIYWNSGMIFYYILCSILFISTIMT